MIQRAPLRELAAELRLNRLDLEEYINRTCDRVEELEPRIQALIPEPDRRQRLLVQARELKSLYPDPAVRPPLYGVLLGIKDIFRVNGLPTRAGSRLPHELFTGPEASSVSALRNAGGLVLGKTVTTEFAYFEPGPTRNPHNTNHTPGGSSSGSAASVAAGYCPLAIGSQTIGSVIRPASFCGIVGFKPSFGRIGIDGLVVISQSLDHVGMFTQDVEGMRLAAPILCQGWRPEEEAAEGRLPVLGVPEGPFLEQAEPETLERFRASLERFRSAGWTVRSIRAFDNLAQIVRNHRLMCAGDMAQIHAGWFEKYESLYRPVTTELIREGHKINIETLIEARKGRQALREELDRLMVRSGIDLWVCPSTIGPAPQGIGSTGDPAMNLVWTHAGLPTLTVPSGAAANGLPLGLQLVARYMIDELLLTWGEVLSRHLG